MRFISLNMYHPRQEELWMQAVISTESIEQITEVWDLKVMKAIGLNIFLRSHRIIFVPHTSVAELYQHSHEDTDSLIYSYGGRTVNTRDLNAMIVNGIPAYEVARPIVTLTPTTLSLRKQLEYKYRNIHFDDYAGRGRNL